MVLFAGNIFRRKGLHVVIRAFPAVVRRIPEACLLVVGDERANNILDRLYRLRLHAEMRPGLKDGWLLRRAEYVPDGELATRIAAAEVAVFPYQRRYGSASGIFHRILAAGRPAICSNIPTFAEANDAWGERLPDLFPARRDVGAWSRAMIRILSDEPLRRRAMAASRALGRETSWSAVARQHLRLYRDLLSSRFPAGRELTRRQAGAFREKGSASSAWDYRSRGSERDADLIVKSGLVMAHADLVEAAAAVDPFQFQGEEERRARDGRQKAGAVNQPRIA